MQFYVIGESKCFWNSRGPEHKPGMHSSNDSFIKQHVETTNHEIHPNYVEILERGVDNLSKRLFLRIMAFNHQPQLCQQTEAIPKGVPAHCQGF